MAIEVVSLPSFENLPDKGSSALVEAGQALIAQIHRRVSRGIGVNDAAMPRYSEATAKQRAKRGRETRVRNLMDSGSMLRSIHLESVSVEGSTATVTIGFSNAQDRLKAEYNQRIAPWFGASPSDKKIIIALLREHMGQAMQEKK